MKNGVFVFLTDEVLNAELPGTTIDVHQIKAAGRGKKTFYMIGRWQPII